MQQQEVKAALGKHLSQINQDYNKNLQIARYTDLSSIDKCRYLIYAGIDRDQLNHVFFMNGNKQSDFEQDKMHFYYISQLDQKIDQKPYILVYIVAENNGSNEFTKFRKNLKTLPMKYYLQCKAIYVYHASLLVRSMLFFQTSKRGKLWQKKTQFVGEIQTLFQQPNFMLQWIELLPPYLQFAQLPKPGDKSLTISQIKVKQNSSVFGVPLKNYEINQYGIPIILDHLIQFFKKKPERLLSTDLFRKCGSIDEEAQLQELLEQGNYDCLQVVEDINIVCAMIKRFFSHLPDPLISFELYKIICTQIQGVNQEKELQFIDAIFCKMSHQNRTLLQFMASFLISISEHSETNHMTNQNLAIVFAPCFLRPEVFDQSQIVNIGLTIKYVAMILNSFPKMYPNFSYRIFLTNQNSITSSNSSSTSSNGGETVQQNQLSEHQFEQQFQQELSQDFKKQPQNN